MNIVNIYGINKRIGMMDSLWWGFILYYATEKHMACFATAQHAHYSFRFEWLNGFVSCWFFGVFVVLPVSDVPVPAFGGLFGFVSCFCGGRIKIKPEIRNKKRRFFIRIQSIY